MPEPRYSSAYFIRAKPAKIGHWFCRGNRKSIAKCHQKRQRKGCDWIIANQVGGDADPVFGSALNQAMLISANGVDEWPQMQKTDLAETLADHIEAELTR